MTERLPRGVDPRIVAERRVTEALARGSFDGSSFAGRPLDLSDAGDPDWWVRRKLRDEQVALPPALQLRRDRDELLAGLDALPSEAAVRAALETLDARIRYAASHAISGPPSTLVPLDIEALVAGWQERRPPPPPPAPQPVAGRRRWWQVLRFRPPAT